MPNSCNIPFPEMLNPETNTMKSPEDLQKVFDTAGIDLERPLVGTCGTGNDPFQLHLSTILLLPDYEVQPLCLHHQTNS